LLRNSKEDRLVVIDGDLAAQFFQIRGTQSAPFGGVPATGRRIDLVQSALEKDRDDSAARGI
jgi:predicted ester cyclase